MRTAVRASTLDDVATLVGDKLAYRGQLITLTVDGEPAVIGGLSFRPDGVWATAIVTDKGRAAPLALHRAARDFFRNALRRGIRPIFALAEPDVARSEAWLTRLGFRETERTVTAGRRVWVLE